MSGKLMNILKRDPRKPAVGGHLISLSGAVMIHTHDGHNIVLTPKFARELARLLPQAARDAEGVLPNPVVLPG